MADKNSAGIVSAAAFTARRIIAAPLCQNVALPRGCPPAVIPSRPASLLPCISLAKIVQTAGIAKFISIR